jgi:hypothetical protein
MESIIQCESCGLSLTDSSSCPICDNLQDQIEEPLPADEFVAVEVHDDETQPSPPPEDSSWTADTPTEPTVSESQPETADDLSEQVSEMTDIDQSIENSTLTAGGDLNVIGELTTTIYKQDLAEVSSSTVTAEKFHVGNNYYGIDGSGKEERSLYSLTLSRPRSHITLAPALSRKLEESIASLKRTGLLFVDCAYKKLALDAGYAVSAGLRVANPANDKVLIFNDLRQKDLEFTIQKLCTSWPDETERGVIVVDAYGTSVETFADSILKDTAWVEIAKQELKARKLYLTVVVSSEYAQKRLDRASYESDFGHWPIPFLPTFLEQNYPANHLELGAQIARQREQGIWEAEESTFCDQLFRYHNRGELERMVTSGGPVNPDERAAELLEQSDQVEKTVLYTAALFQRITPLEFRRVVERLLAGRQITVPATTSSSGKEPLENLWEEEKDRIYTRWIQESSINGESMRVVSLADADLREPLRRLLEQKHPFYLIDRFRALLSQGIFFDPSVRLAENTTRLAVQMASLHPDEFNESWLYGLIERAAKSLGPEESNGAGSDLMFQFLRDSSRPMNLALGRIADLFRCMFESTSLQPVVHASLEQLVKRGFHEEALWLVKRLQFCPDFDQLHWLRQLLHRGDAKTRQQTYYYLYSHLKRLGNGVYEGLSKIESWLPRVDRSLESYAPFDCFALRLLVQYCLESIQRFNPAHFGSWPSRYPLLAVSDLETARKRISLLANWLLHPGIEATLDNFRMGGTHMTLVAAFLAEWSFILCGPDLTQLSHQSAENTSPKLLPGEDNGDGKPPLTASFLFDLLFEEFASRTSLNQQLEMLKYWNRLDFDLLRFLGSLPPGSPMRSQLSWKHKSVGELMERIRDRGWRQL